MTAKAVISVEARRPSGADCDELWSVVGGAANGGIIVRQARELTSPQAAGGERLATGSIVRQVAVDGDRLRYELVSGQGPAGGWVSRRAAGRDFLAPAGPAARAGGPRPLGGTPGGARRPAAAQDPPDAPPAAGALRAAAGAAADAVPHGAWHEVLGVSPSATQEDVRRSFRGLALQHHPDKRQGAVDVGDVGDVFRRVQEAYEEGLHQVAGAHPASGELGLVSCDGPSMPVSIFAPKAHLRKACDEFEHLLDVGESSSVPSEVSNSTVEELVEWLLEGSCVCIDTREPCDKYGKNATPIPGAVTLGYTELLKRPESVARPLAALQEHAERGARLVSYSTHGSPTSGNCATVCCILADVFGFDIDMMSCLEDGYLMWRRFIGARQSVAEQLRAKYGSAG